MYQTLFKSGYPFSDDPDLKGRLQAGGTSAFTRI
jgi:hypothetical protein